MTISKLRMVRYINKPTVHALEHIHVDQINLLITCILQNNHIHLKLRLTVVI